VLVQCFDRVARTGRLKAACSAQPRAEEEAVGAHGPRQQPSREKSSCPWLRHLAAHRANNCSSSRLAAAPSAVEDALGNWRVSNGAVNRTTHCPGGNTGRARATRARILRLSKLRVAALAAWRFGTTIPSPQRTASARLFTEGASVGACAVDNSWEAVPLTCPLIGADGADRWCNEKWALRATTGVASACAKSARCRLRQPLGWSGPRPAAAGQAMQAIGSGAAGVPMGSVVLRRQGACGPLRGGQQSLRGPRETSCAREIRECARVGFSKLDRYVSWQGLGGGGAVIRETQDYSKNVISGQRLGT